MNSIKQIRELNKRELEAGVTPEGSWHADYRDTAFVYIGGLSFDLTEGDIVTIFSQFGEPVYINLVRDKETGKSKGFAFLKYEDQRSCDLAVDNLGGATVLGRVLRVDHTRYKRKDDEDLQDNTYGELGPPGANKADTESDEEEARPMIREERELAQLLREQDDDDPMKAYMIEQKKEEVEKALKALKVDNPRKKSHRSRRHRDGSETRHERRHRHHRDESRDRKDRKHRRDRDDERDRRRRSSRDRSEGDGDHRRRRRHETSDDERASRYRRRSNSYERRDGEHRRRRRSHSPQGD
jgi:RNA-binding motif protein, X-linked 2